MKCCGNCFGDYFLAELVAELSSESGSCSFCGSAEMALVSPDSLYEVFDGLREALYQESSNTESVKLSHLLKLDWGLFGTLDEGVVDSLIEVIIPDAEGQGYVPVVAHDADVVLKWDELRDELQHENRFFPQKLSFRVEREGILFEHLTARGNSPEFFFRARLLSDEEPYGLNKMGKPDPELASNGRANPMGIPYLYVATNPETAIAEIRPHKHADVCVATFRLSVPLKFADLCNPLNTVSPFQLDDDGLRLLPEYMPFLVRMGEELSKPVSPHKSHFEYLPSQYLCEYLKQRGFHGVAYKSSVGTGLNYAIFDDETLEGVEVKVYKVDEVNLITSEH